MVDPAAFAVAETLKTGVPVTVRALHAGDRARMAAALGNLGRESIYTRLFTYRTELTEAALDRVMRFDADREVALVVTTGRPPDEIVIGGGRYVVTDPVARTAEVAFVVEEDFHGQGIAGRLLRHLAVLARGRGIAAFEAEVLAGNKAMLAVFGRAGLPMTTRAEDGVVHVTLALGAAPA